MKLCSAAFLAVWGKGGEEMGMKVGFGGILVGCEGFASEHEILPELCSASSSVGSL